MTASPSSQIPSAYDPATVERRVYDNWLSSGYFTPEIIPGSQPFTIIMPPPNVTGELHLGHALTAALQDILIRWRRMLGDSTLWLPGKDHAGIATQWVVERLLASEGTNRHEIGREKFQERVWEWVETYGDTIDEQHKRLGASCDWSRLRFTLDPGPVDAVRTTFVNLFNKGLIYRHQRIINWCPRCATALSDLEVEYQEQDGLLYYIHYPLSDGLTGGGDSYITVATTRPETMLGDTAVAVHPEDERYKHLVGKSVTLPIMGRIIPIVGDEGITPEFGSGALKVTPSHDAMDFEVGIRHNLEFINVVGFDGNMTEEAGKYQGFERFQAREDVAAELDALGLLEKVEHHSNAIGTCQRCSTVVEPLISLQWFVNVGHHDEPDSIAGRAYAAVAHGDIKIVPERFTRVYLNWLENIRDWCISRQLWWGHRIPVWYCGACGQQTSAIEDPSSCASCGSVDIHQDPDVLDTWFSSGLWPHSTLGWPAKTDDLDYFYPTAVMETGYDILFFWVARMIMMGLENTGHVPFRTVFLHGMVRDGSGAKMSKTRGNVLDPLELIDKYGTDALRFALTTGTAPGNDLRLTEGKLESARNFANKVWNAARFVMTSVDGQTGTGPWSGGYRPEHREDRWIVGRLNRTIDGVSRSLETFELGEAQQQLYDFIWNDFCDWYIEMAKIRTRSGLNPSPLPTLAHVLERTLRLLHPFMPFITEEIWQNLVDQLPSEGEHSPSIMVSTYPEVTEGYEDSQAEGEISLVMQTVRAIRNTRAQLRIPPGQYLEAVVEADGLQNAIEEEAEVIRTLTRIEPLSVVSADSASTGQPKGITLLINPLVVRLPLEGVVDLPTEAERLRKELEDCQRNLDRVSNLVSKPEFLAKARPDVVATEQERLKSLQETSQRLGEILAQLES